MAYWNADSGFNCLDTVVESVIEDGWTHHIPRLMVLGNIASLLDVNPRQLTDWFHAAFIDAYDWVVEPNVLGMAFRSRRIDDDKPHISGAAYINRMSDYCKECQYDPKKNCPITNLYWDFISRHSESFLGNHRMSIPLRNSSRRDEEKRILTDKRLKHGPAGCVYQPEVTELAEREISNHPNSNITHYCSRLVISSDFLRTRKRHK